MSLSEESAQPDAVTPSQAAARLDIPAGTVRSWISRRGIKPIGTIGRYNVYDYRELARVEAEMRYDPASEVA